VFDLDDTLYDELTFVRSGFRAVAHYLQQNNGLAVDETVSFMCTKLNTGRGQIFDELLRHYGVYSKKLVQKCIAVYRSHTPDISLNADAKDCLQRFSQRPIYIVTDGNKIVQKNKLMVLGIYEYAKFCFRTYQYGIKNSKPSPHCFLKICERENVTPNEVVYIADNPNKDFVGIKPLGFKTIRLLQGQFADVRESAEFEAEYQIHSLNELTDVYLQSIFTAARM
jgi:putative hydrolase of the HAD superfamily